jgi:glyoxylase-like metal-dependent hydrolase (beta-lactamase superfamily II)
MIKLQNFVFNDLGVNAFILYDITQECVIIDPGFNSVKEQSQFTDFISQNNLRPVYIINTHGHFDHVFGNKLLKDLYQCPLLMHHDDLNLIENIDKYAGIFGFFVDKAPKPDRYIHDNETLTFGGASLKVIHVPGHSPGSICLYSEIDNLLICGDVLFNGSIGRTDLPAGNHGLLIRGIREKLMILPRDTVVWPGHGPKTTIGLEHDTNPFLKSTLK